MEIQKVPLDSLTPDPDNARRHPEKNREAIRSSLLRFGQVEPLVVQESTRVVIGGNGRLEEMRDLGWDVVDVVFVDVEDDQAKALGVALNRSGELATWDVEKLGDLLVDLEAMSFDIGEIGFDEDAIADIFGDIPETVGEGGGEGGGVEVKDVAPVEVDEQAEPVSRPGEVYYLGDHVLVCGDSAIASTWDLLERFRGDEVGTILLTDPPYSSGARQEGKKAGTSSVGRLGGYNYKTATDEDRAKRRAYEAEKRELARDNLTARGYVTLIGRVLHAVGEVTQSYVFTDWRMWNHTFDALESSGMLVRNMIVWVKGNGLGAPWKNSHELIAFGSILPMKWEKGFGADNVIECAREYGDHPTVKPVELLKKLLDNSKPGIVVDPFGGSGSSMIAAQATGRRCFMVELNPRFADVIRKRWGAFCEENDIEDRGDAL